MKKITKLRSTLNSLNQVIPKRSLVIPGAWCLILALSMETN